MPVTDGSAALESLPMPDRTGLDAGGLVEAVEHLAVDGMSTIDEAEAARALLAGHRRARNQLRVAAAIRRVVARPSR